MFFINSELLFKSLTRRLVFIGLIYPFVMKRNVSLSIKLSKFLKVNNVNYLSRF